jgi:hypothetical protein
VVTLTDKQKYTLRSLLGGSVLVPTSTARMFERLRLVRVVEHTAETARGRLRVEITSYGRHIAERS